MNQEAPSALMITINRSVAPMNNHYRFDPPKRPELF
jgi:hypothetical protein